MTSSYLLQSLLPSIVSWSGAATLLFGSALAYVLVKTKSSSLSSNIGKIDGARHSAVSSDNIVSEGREALNTEKYPGGYITILYGSQTGTAESFAAQLQREGEARHGFKIRIVDLEDVSSTANVRNIIFNRDYLQISGDEKDKKGIARIIFVVATYGEGESTDSAEAFVRLLKWKRGIALSSEGDVERVGGAVDDLDGREELTDSNFFTNAEYSVFGLGNSQYEHFNAMGKFFDESLSALGATRVLNVGLGDDDQDLEGDFETWKDTKLWPTFVKKYNKSKSLHISNGKSAVSALPECPYKLEYIPALRGVADFQQDEVSSDLVHNSTRHYFTAKECPLTASRELCSTKDGGSTLHLELDVSERGAQLKYNTADNLGVLPVNEASIVENLANALGYDLNNVFRLYPVQNSKMKNSVKGEYLFPTPCTVRDCLSRYCDLSTPPRRSELKQLAQFASDPLDMKALERMASKEGKTEYKDKIVDAHVGIAEIISKLCKSVAMPLEHLVALCPRLQPRFYTISSSSSVYPSSVHLTISILNEQLPGGRVFKGVCTDYLANLAAGNTCRVFVRHSAFRLPPDSSKPIILIGPGTGIAPMRALLQERAYQSKFSSVGKNILYFGCKRRDSDYLYSNEINAYVNDGTLAQLYVAFSREQEHKVYVQHLLAENSKDTWDLIDREEAYIFVCGGTKMGSDVTDCIAKIVSNQGAKSDKEARDYVDYLRSQGRYIQELWS